jgi:hypothetical protein
MTNHASPMRPLGRGFVLAHPSDAISHLSDRVVLIVVFVALFLLNYAGNVIEAVTNISSVDNDLAHSRTASGAQVLGFVAVAIVLADLKSDRVLRWWDYLAVFCITLVSVYPSPTLRAIAMTCVGLLFVVRADKRLASFGQLCIGLVWIDFWGSLALSLISSWLLPVETALAYLPLSFLGKFSLQGITISSGNDFTLMVGEPCSAFHNTIITTFIWLSLIKIQRLSFRLEYFKVLMIGLATIIALNTIRICLMSFSDNQYLFWHMGPGLWIVKIVMLTTVLVLFYFGLRPNNQPAGVISPSVL